jgi:4,5-dihydroxyphthalate decarboxylase
MLGMTIATGRYDRVAALHDGRVRPEGIDVNWLTLNVEQTFWRMFRHQEFDASELSLSGTLVRLGRGVSDFVPIPVFLSRTFRHECLYTAGDSPLNGPDELAGKRVGVPEFQITAAVWARGLLEDEYGVRQEDVTWVQGGVEQSGRKPQEPVSPPGVTIEEAPPGVTLVQMLLDGRIDALISPRRPSAFADGSGRVRRLIPDVWAASRAYYERTRIFPIMHLVAIRRPIVEANPWVPQTLSNAFLAAKRLSDESLRDTTALPVGLPFLVQHTEETAALMGEDFWPYGVEANRPTLEAFVRYAHRQGLIPERPELDDIFPVSTREVSRI